MKNIQKDKKETASEGKDTYFKFVTTLAILLIVFILSYFLIGFFYTGDIKFGEDEETQEEVNIDNDTIMLGQMFDQPKEEYYVLIYDVSDTKSFIKTWLSSYQGKDDAVTVYTVDSTKKFNANYLVTEGSNKSATSLADLKVIAPTMIKISNKQITEYVEGEDEIISKLKG